MITEPQIGYPGMNSAMIRWECQRRGWNQQELARQSSLSRATISVAYRGGNVTGRTARLIQHAFDETKPTLDNLLRRAG